MAQELIYTSVPRGLRLGTSGFCTVACTRGMAPNYIETLESLSGYTPVFPPNHPRADDNPLVFSHYRFTIGGRPVSVMSRVAAAGVDYTKRPNKFAHHLALDIGERSAGGPAWVMRQPGVFLQQWEGDPRFLDQPRKIPAGDPPPASCVAWQEQLGDPGWAGVLAQAFLEDPARPSFIIFKPGLPVLNLIDEAIRLLPVARRWDVTFSTYFMSLPARATCAWRCCLAGSRVLKQARRMPDALVLDLDAGSEQPAIARRRLERDSPFIAYARTGTPPALTVNRDSTEQGRKEAQFEFADEEVNAGKADGSHPRSPAAVWLDSARSEPISSNTSSLNIILFVLIIALLISLFFNFLPSSKSAPSNAPEELTTQSEEPLVNDPTSGDEVLALRRVRKGLEDERSALQKDLKSANAAVKSLEEEIKVLKRDLAVAIDERDKAKHELAESQKAQNPSAVACFGKLDAMSFSADGIFLLPVQGGFARGKVTQLGWWGKSEQIDKDEMGLAGNDLLVKGPDPNYDDKMIPCMRISVSSEGVLFTKLPGASLTSDRMQKLKRVAWIELELDKNNLVVFTRQRLDGKVVLKRNSRVNSPRYTGSVKVEPVLLKGLSGRWDAPPETDGNVSRDVRAQRLTFTVTFGSEKARTMNPVLNHPLEMVCDDQVVASFKLVLEEN